VAPPWMWDDVLCTRSSMVEGILKVLCLVLAISDNA
jgi:hypothetical protein